MFILNSTLNFVFPLGVLVFPSHLISPALSGFPGFALVTAQFGENLCQYSNSRGIINKTLSVRSVLDLFILSFVSFIGKDSLKKN